MIAFERDLEPRLGPDGDLEHLADWGSKLAGKVARRAGSLHVVQTVTEGGALRSRVVSAETMCAVIQIAESFLIPHAKTAFALMGQTLPSSRRAMSYALYAGGLNPR
jgi:hypothetical protein